MDKIKLDRALFDFMEKITKERKYNYEQFIDELSTLVKYHYDFKGLFLESAEIEPYFDKDKREETLEKLLKAYMLGYKEKDDKYTIVLFEKGGYEFVLWEIEDDYIIGTRDRFIDDDESVKSSFTRAEISNKFPRLWPLAQKVK